MPKLIDSFESGTDADTRVLDAYIKQCTAEAQEGQCCQPHIFRVGGEEGKLGVSVQSAVYMWRTLMEDTVICNCLSLENMERGVLTRLYVGY